MYKVLVVDDSQRKLGKISEVIHGIAGGESLEHDSAGSANEAVSALMRDQYDLVILDAMLPMRAGEEPKRDGGRLLLDTIYRQGARLKRPHSIVGLTAYQDVHAEMSESFSSQGVQLILYSEESESWAGPLANLVSYQLGSRAAPEADTFREDVCILTALKAIELEAVLKLPANWISEPVEGDDTQYFRGVFTRGKIERTVIAAAAIEVGMPAAACLAAKMIYTFRPRYLCMCGITAGIGMNCGDVVVAERTWDYGSGKYVTLEGGAMAFRAEPRHLLASGNVTERIGVYIATRKERVAAIQAHWPGNPAPTPLGAALGPMASGAAVVENREIIDGLRGQNRKTAAVEMEGYGVFMAGRTCSKPQPEVLVVKSICDFGVPPKVDDFQRYAAFTSAQFLYDVLIDCMP